MRAGGRYGSLTPVRCQILLMRLVNIPLYPPLRHDEELWQILIVAKIDKYPECCFVRVFATRLSLIDTCLPPARAGGLRLGLDLDGSGVVNVGRPHHRTG